jgi:hypothetical protein
MSRKPKIPFGDKRKKELANINKRVSNKKSRIKSNYNMVVDVQTRTAKDFNSVQEYNQYIKEMKHFLNRNNREYQYVKSKSGMVMNRKEYNELERTLKRVDRMRQEEKRKREKMSFKHGKKKTEFTVSEQEKLMGDTRFHETKHKVKNHFHTEKDPIKFQEWLKKVDEQFGGNPLDKKTQRYKEIYITGLQNVFGEDANDLVKHIRNMPNKEFLDVYYSNTVGDVQYIYLPAQAKAKLRNIREGFGVE